MKRLRCVLCGTALLAVSCLGLGCTEHLGSFTVLATKNIDLTNFNSQAAENTTPVTGQDKTSQIFGYGSIPNLKEAVDRAEEKGNACALTNARIDASWWTCVVYGETAYTATGNPVPR